MARTLEFESIQRLTQSWWYRSPTLAPIREFGCSPQRTPWPTRRRRTLRTRRAAPAPTRTRLGRSAARLPLRRWGSETSPGSALSGECWSSLACCVLRRLKEAVCASFSQLLFRAGPVQRAERIGTDWVGCERLGRASHTSLQQPGRAERLYLRRHGSALRARARRDRRLRLRLRDRAPNERRRGGRWREWRRRHSQSAVVCDAEPAHGDSPALCGSTSRELTWEFLGELLTRRCWQSRGRQLLGTAPIAKAQHLSLVGPACPNV